MGPHSGGVLMTKNGLKVKAYTRQYDTARQCIVNGPTVLTTALFTDDLPKFQAAFYWLNLTNFQQYRSDFIDMTFRDYNRRMATTQSQPPPTIMKQLKHIIKGKCPNIDIFVSALKKVDCDTYNDFAMHREAIRREAMHREAMYREAMRREAMHREAMHREAMRREYMYRNARRADTRRAGARFGRDEMQNSKCRQDPHWCNRVDFPSLHSGYVRYVR